MLSRIRIEPGGPNDGSDASNVLNSENNVSYFSIGRVADQFSCGYHCPIEDVTPYPVKLPRSTSVGSVLRNRTLDFTGRI